MNDVHWIIQENISKKDLNELIDLLKQKGISYETFFHIPFDNQYPELPVDKECFVYAASAVTDNIKNSYPEFKGVFASSDQINISEFHLNSPEMMWNNPFFIGVMKDVLLLSPEKDEDEFFIRPVIDDKSFAGQVMTQIEIKNWIQDLIVSDTEINPETCRILLAKLQYPIEEYRLFIGHGKVFASTRYRKDMELNCKEGCSQDVVSFAEHFYMENQLPDSCVIDIATGDNRIGVIEVNSINNSGFYATNKSDWIDGINNTIIKQKHNKLKFK